MYFRSQRKLQSEVSLSESIETDKDGNALYLMDIVGVDDTMLKDLQDKGAYTELMVRSEEVKTLPFGDIWNYYCEYCGVPKDGEWFEKVKEYENDVLLKRN